jgi:hypothetical protein
MVDEPLFDVVLIVHDFMSCSYFLVFWIGQDQDVLADINGQELSLKLHKNGALDSFEGASGK